MHVGTRADGSISRCVISKRGRPEVTFQPPLPSLLPRRTPKSVATYKFFLASSRTMSFTGKSPVPVGVGNAAVPASTFRFVNEPEPGAAPPSSTSKTWPGTVGVVALQPEYVTQAWLVSAGSG